MVHPKSLLEDLLTRCSGKALDIFSSSDRRPGGGLEPGQPWMEQVIKKLRSAERIICLLTPAGVRRPWVLFEAGFARGNNDRPLHNMIFTNFLRSSLRLPISNSARKCCRGK